MVKLVWECKRDVRRAMEPFIKKHAHLIPSWCHTLYLGFSLEGANEGVIASASTQVEYRTGRIDVHSIYLTYDEEEQERAIVHELLHLQIAGLATFSGNLIKRTMVEDSTLEEWAWEEHRKAMEGVVEDLRLAFSLRGG